MSSSDPRSIHLGLPYMAPAQALKHITHNEALLALDEVVQLSVLRRDLASPPNAPQDGDRYIVPPASIEEWAGEDMKLAVWRDGTWHFIAPRPGWRSYDEAEGALLIFDGVSWTEVQTDLDQLSEFGINTQADTTNRLAIKSDAVLHSHDDVTPGSGDVRHVLNKDGETQTGSFLFQTGYSGRAEIGLLGSNDLELKVSPDGSNWITAMIIDHQTGVVQFPATPSFSTPALPTDHDIYVNPTTGDDSNDGSHAAPFATLAALRTVLDAHNDTATTLKAYVAGATYTDQHLNLVSLAGPAELTFGADAIIRWTLGTDQSGIQPGSQSAASLTVYGNGLVIEGFNTGTGNGLGASNNQLIAYNVIVRDCLDGVSGHGTAHIETFNCRFENCTKYAVSHVSTSSSRHVDCYFQCTDGAIGIGALLNDSTHSFENCEFDSPTGSVKEIVGGSGTSLTGCRLGSLSQPISVRDEISVSDSFVNVTGQGNATLSFTRVFGRLALRLRDGGSLSVTDSVLDGSLNATGNGFIYSDYDPGAFGGVSVSETVITGYATAVSVGASGRLAYWQAAMASMTDNILFANTTNFGAHISAEVGQSITGTDTDTPTMGGRGTYAMTDWAIGGGLTAGFTAAEAVDVGIRSS